MFSERKVSDQGLSRRDWGRALLAAPLAANAAPPECVLQNHAIRSVIVVDRGDVRSRLLTHLEARETVEPSRELFAFEFEGGSTLRSSDLAAQVTQSSASSLELLFKGTGVETEVRVRYELPAGKTYLRKQVRVRQKSGSPRRLLRADLDNWQGVRRGWRSMTADRLRYGSHPIYCERWWAGVEFVAAFNEYGENGFVLRSRPGGRLVGSDWVPLHSTVVGVAGPNEARESFLEYMEDIRLAPPRMVACYNSWWTLPTVVKQRDNLTLIRELKAKMFDRHGVFFDIVTTDMGWSNPRSIWEIDRSILPVGFDDIRAIVEPAGGKLGLWMSPSEQYPPVCDYDWAEKNGYIVLRPAGPVRAGRPAVSLADPRYRAETKAALRRLIRENRLGHIKYDGFLAEEDRPHHGLLPGPDSVEPLAEHSLELLKASKEENPALDTEPTYLNSHANYISPWILQHSDTVWANSGGDCPPGLGPAPDYRESQTNAREYYIFSSLDEVWLPQNALHYFDIVHADTGQGFPNHAAMAFGRGRFFVSTYVNPKVMSAEDWRIYSGLLGWARANRDILRNTVVLPSRVELGEPYAYAHWLGTRGIVAVRNPSNESQEYVLDLQQARAPRELADAVCYSQYPYRKGIAAGLSGNSRVRLTLAPWELLFVEIVPRRMLREAVVLGARWYRESGQAASFVAEEDVASVRVLKPGGIESEIRIPARPRHRLQGKMISTRVRPVPESEWLPAEPKRSAVFPFHYPAEPDSEEIQSLERAERVKMSGVRVPTVEFEVECEVSAPPGVDRFRVLLLVEFPGREFRPGHASAAVDDRPARVEESHSAGHVGYFVASQNNAWKEMLSHESQWRWYLCEVDAGPRRVRFRGIAGHPNPRIGVWAWAEVSLDAAKKPLEGVFTEPAMPQYRAGIEQQGICLKRPVAVLDR